jgi:ATP-dependent Clp protease adapter protein ClpS
MDYAAQWRGKPVAVKVMMAAHNESVAELESFRREVMRFSTYPVS